MGIIEEQLGERLKGTFKNYIIHSFEHALSDEKNECDILQTVMNCQAALELLTKLYVMRNADWKAIVEPASHNSSETEILRAIQNGQIKTTQFSINKEQLEKLIKFTKTDIIAPASIICDLRHS